MRRTALLVALVMLLAMPAIAAEQRRLIGTTQDHSSDEIQDCAHFHSLILTPYPSRVEKQEQRDLSVTDNETLTVRASQEGGIAIRGWDKPTARLIVCKSAAAATNRQAARLLESVTVTSTQGTIVSLGPPTNDKQVWWVNMILYVPKSATLDVSSANGGIAIRNMNGKVTAQTTNGGISVAHSAGDHKVTTENGGISLEKISGRVEATTQNGPIALRLRDMQVPGIEARTEVEGEILCRLEFCSEGNWTADRKQLRLGSNSPSIRLSTLSAPIMIENVR